MLAVTTTLIATSLFAITHGSLLHPIYGYEYSQRASRPAAYTLSLPFYPRSVAAGLPFSNPIGGSHKATDCGHLHESEQGEFVQSVATTAAASTSYPHQHQQTQWTPVVYSPAPIALNPVVYHSLVGETKIHSWPSRPQVLLHAPPPPPPTWFEGVSSAYGSAHHPQF